MPGGLRGIVEDTLVFRSESFEALQPSSRIHFDFCVVRVDGSLPWPLSQGIGKGESGGGSRLFDRHDRNEQVYKWMEIKVPGCAADIQAIASAFIPFDCTGCMNHIVFQVQMSLGNAAFSGILPVGYIGKVQLVVFQAFIARRIAHRRQQPCSG